MGARFFSHCSPAHAGDAGAQVGRPAVGLEGLERQQALVVAALRRAEGHPVSYAALRDAGIEFPASVVSELELAGVPIERCYRSGRQLAGVRLDPADDPGARAVPSGRQSAPSEPAAKSRRRKVGLAEAVSRVGVSTVRELVARLRSKDPGAKPRRVSGQARTTSVPEVATQTDSSFGGVRPLMVNLMSRRTAAVTALVALSVGVALLIATGIGGTARRAHVPVGPVGKRPASRVISAVTTHQAASPSRPVSSAPRVRVSPVLATELEAHGHGLLLAGRYADAVPVLKRAVLATGASLGACGEPASSTCLTYAYALYDLGRALRLSGDPAAAVSILERRLQIDNQRPTVDAELRLAREGIG